MPVLQQDEFFHAGTYGFPLRITLVDKNGVALPLGPTPGPALTAAVLDFTRPDKTHFQRTLSLPAAIYNMAGVLQYIFLQGDLTIGGSYDIKATLTFANASVMTLRGPLQVLN